MKTALGIGYIAIAVALLGFFVWLASELVPHFGWNAIRDVMAGRDVRAIVLMDASLFCFFSAGAFSLLFDRPKNNFRQPDQSDSDGQRANGSHTRFLVAL